ncbi:granulocyte-macrophage colony-stimulating factor receptor subunit alpha-like isoform X4 [Lagopus muta]|uniref:granulocyte-macrophage colony-stimulating factor receptor subunit alpha-like isoform X4 n=1 Tax=Lagopus muta TaxID=64668 RepID=UPI00209F99E2|nr:granulocyte-macrophage colony-stimulating factor receptor subunit alpha-like isoform X4 [Lagopus muta]
MNVTAIENFVCVIYNISFMNCTWHVDRNASGDAQYFLYWKTSRNEDFVRCQNYITDNCGRHTGCRFQNVTIKENRKAYFLVNESRNGQNILPYRTTIYLYEIEKLTPPLNVTVNCTGVSHSCEIQWQRPHTSHVDRDICFKYEIIIEKKADPEERIKNTSKTGRIITGNSYLFDSFNANERKRTTDIYFIIHITSDISNSSKSRTFLLHHNHLFKNSTCYCTTAKRPIPRYLSSEFPDRESIHKA